MTPAEPTRCACCGAPATTSRAGVECCDRCDRKAGRVEHVRTVVPRVLDRLFAREGEATP